MSTLSTEEEARRAAKNAWFLDGPQEVAAGIVRMPLTVSVKGLHAVNVYVLSGPEGIDLVDAGDADAMDVEQLDEALRGIGHRIDDVRQTLVTHIHPDHYSLAPKIRERVGAKVFLGRDEQANLEAINSLIRGERRMNILDDLERVGGEELKGSLRESRLRPAEDAEELGGPDVWMDDAQTLDAQSGPLTTIHTPGHTQGHIVLRDADRGLYFTGDHVLPHITPSIGFESAPRLSALSEYLRSLAMLLEVPDGKMLPAHGPVTDSMHSRVRALLEHHDGRLAATQENLAESGSTPYEVAQKLTWTNSDRAFGELTAFDQFLASTETAAHLETLVERGSVRRAAQRGTAHVFERAE